MYPALAVLQALRKFDLSKYDPVQESSNLHILWVGGEGGMEYDLVSREKLPYESVPAAGVHGVGIRSLPGNLWKLFQGFRKARVLLRNFKPEVMFFTGGYVAVPVALAGRIPDPSRKRPRTLLYIPDIEPGLALRTLTQFADHIAVTVKETGEYLSSKRAITVTGYPTRQGLRAWNKEAAYQALGLNRDLPTLLVLGGSKGARSINRAVLQALPKFLQEMQIVHVCGNLEWEEVETARSQHHGSLPEHIIRRYHHYPYLHDEIGAAFTLADLVVCRAGASTLGELPLFGIPAILVPYPFAWRYQQLNAEYLAKHEAAVILQDADMQSQLSSLVLDLMRDDKIRMRMRAAMRSLETPGAAQKIADMIAASTMSLGGHR